MLLGGRRAGELRDAGGELPRGLAGLVAVEDSGDLLHLLAEGTVGAACAVRRRASAYDSTALGGDELAELESKTGLPDARRPEDRDEVGPLVLDDSLPDPGQRGELAVTSDESGWV